MHLSIRRIKWLARSWPVFVLSFATFAVVHWANWTPPPTTLTFNKFAGAALQGIGALLVLVSINSNLGLARGHGMLAELQRYLNDWPRRPQVVNLVAAACGQSSASGSTASVRVMPSTLEGRVAELERTHAELEQTVFKQKGELIGMVEDVRHEGRQALVVHERRVVALAAQVEETAVGGFKVQAFGVGLAILGSVLSIYS